MKSLSLPGVRHLILQICNFNILKIDWIKKQVTELALKDRPTPASMLIDPEDKAINANINERGYVVRRSVNRAIDFLVEDWKLQIEAHFPGELLMSSMDMRWNKKDGEESLTGTIVWDLGDVLFILYCSNNNTVFFHFWTDSEQIAEEHCRWIRKNLFIEKKADVFDEETNIRQLTFWGNMGGDYEAFTRDVTLFDWDEKTKANYPPKVFEQLNSLLELEPPIEGGKLLLLHGDPGTGKSSFLCTLAREWTEWCHTSFITDPEIFLGASGATLRVVTWDYLPYIGREVDPKNAYHLLIIEDADELITANAKDRVGQALSRLLNLGDGLLGHATNLLICITTNIKMEELHPAIIRAGRCLANIHFDKFSSDEAIHWLSIHHPELSAKQIGLKSGNEYSLAELYELTSNAKRIVTAKEELVVGTYL